MKKLYIKILTLGVFAMLCNLSFGQTTLSPGDIAIIGLNSDAPKQCAFVLLKDVESGTKINFTDNGWKASNNSFRGNEGTVTWTADTKLNAGKVIIIERIGDFNFSTNGDQVLAYQGEAASPKFIYAIQSNSTVWQDDATSPNNSALPLGLTNGETAVAFGSGPGAGSEFDNISYDFKNQLNSGTRQELLAAISNNENWVGDNSNVTDFSTASFTVNADAPDTKAPVVSFNPTNEAVNVAINTTIAISFDEPVRNIDDSEIIDPTSLIVLKETDASGANVAFTASINGDKNLITITPGAELANGQLYYAALSPVEDKNNNAATLAEITFRTISSTAKTISITSDYTGNRYYTGDNIDIAWESANVNNVDIKLYMPKGNTWQLMQGNEESDGTTSFVIPDTMAYGTGYKLAVVDVTDNTIADTSGLFVVVPTLSIYEIQAENHEGVSDYNGDVVFTSGIVTGIDAGSGYFIQDSAKAWNGIFVYDASNSPVIGDSVTIEALVGEYQSLTELKNVVKLSTVASNKALPNPITVSPKENDKSMESVLIQFINVEVTNPDAGYGIFEVSDGRDTVSVDDDMYKHAATKGDNITITGMGYYSYKKRKILPRFSLDVVSASDTLSSLYRVNNETNVISGFSVGIGLQEFKSNLTAADSATFEVYDADGTTIATTLDDTKLVIVVAADGITSRTYSLSIVTSTDATLSDLRVDDVTITGFTPNTTSYTINLPTSAKTIPEVTYSTTDENASATLTKATGIPGTTTVAVTAEDGKTTLTYSIEFKQNTTAIQNTTVTGLYLFPTIAGTSINLDNATDVEQVEIMNLSGKVLKHVEFSNEQVINLDVSSLKSGAYILKATSKNKVESLRFIKK